jgi:hypothetical protein
LVLSTPRPKERYVHELELGADDGAFTGYLRQRVSRTAFLTASGAGMLLAAFPRSAGAEATPESVQDILNTALTAEHLAVTVLTAAVNNAAQLQLTGLLLAVTQAALAEEVYHAQFLESNGAHPITDTFTVPNPKILTDQNTFLHTLADTAEPLFIAAYMAAVREFTMLKQPVLAKYACQIGATEAEHRAIVRAGLVLTGDASGDPPNNKGFETNLLASVGDAAKQLVSAGFIGGTGQQVTFPGLAVGLQAAGPMASAVGSTTPNSSAPGVPLSATLAAPQASGQLRNLARPE